MTDRAIELAEALANNPWVDPTTRQMCKALLKEWPRLPKRGRPLAKDKAKTLAATEPWADLGMSRRTYFRRKAEGSIGGGE